MKNKSCPKIIRSIIAMRKKLIADHRSGKNTALCLQYIKELTIQMDAYGSKWNEAGWKSFIGRNIEKFLYLIPDNKSGETLKNKLIHESN